MPGWSDQPEIKIASLCIMKSQILEQKSFKLASTGSDPCREILRRHKSYANCLNEVHEWLRFELIFDIPY
jgi:hypothetical protein